MFKDKIMNALSNLISRPPQHDVIANNVMSPAHSEALVHALYDGILGRPADEGGLQYHVNAILHGASLSKIVANFVSSDEFCKRVIFAPNKETVRLPDLTAMFPNKYVRRTQELSIFEAKSNEDYKLLEDAIVKYRYYDSFDVYGSKIDLDKKITAGIALGLGSTSALELGCFTGSVLSVLADKGVDVCGVDASHLAFVLAHENVRGKLRFGDLLDIQFDQRFDTFIAMDVLEHLNPTRLPLYIDKIDSLLNKNGFIILNSPMFGPDIRFGEAFPVYFAEWTSAGTQEFWRHIHCDARGWPVHGHLIFASPNWWEATFQSGGFVRDPILEEHTQILLKTFFEKLGPGRKSMFILRRPYYSPNYEQLKKKLSEHLIPLVCNL